MNIIIEKIKSNNISIDDQKVQITSLYNEIAKELQRTNNTINSAIQDNYKKIDSIFIAKAKLEAEVNTLKNSLLISLIG